MNRTFACLLALLVACAWGSAACGGKVVVDGLSDTVSSGAGGAASSSGVVTSATGAGGACDSASHTLDFADFNTTCTSPSDCMPVFLGDFCQGCTCAFSAINVADKAKYEAEAQIKAAGAPTGGCFCPASIPICVEGQCNTKTP